MNFMTENIDHSKLIELIFVGAFKDAHIVGQKYGWLVTFKHGDATLRLVTQKTNKIKIFNKLDSLVEYLKGIGISHFDVDASLFQIAPKVKNHTSNECSAYNKWFVECVEKAIILSKKPSVLLIDHSDVMKMLENKKARLISQNKEFFRKRRENKLCK